MKFKKVQIKLFSALMTFFMLTTFIPIYSSAEKYTETNENKFKGSADKYEILKSKLSKDDNIKKVHSKLDNGLLELTGKSKIVRTEGKKTELKPEGSIREEIKKSAVKRATALNQFVPKGSRIKGVDSKAPGDLVYVYIKLKSILDIDSVKQIVYKVTDEDKDNSLLVAWVEVDKLGQLELSEKVEKVWGVLPPKVNALTEGDSLHNTDKVREIGDDFDGRGVKIGVVSDGVDNAATSIALGDLPANLQILSNAVGGDEGTAMLEIVHDLAPGADLYFHDCGNNTLAFNNAISNLIAAGCKVIVDDIGWRLEPFFEDGVVAKHVSQAVKANNIVYISSAGNNARNHYQGKYYSDGNNWNDFSSGTSDNKDLYVRLEHGEYVIAVLQWDDKFGASGNDYDLYLFNATTGEYLSSSEEVQAGNGEPLEALIYHNTSGEAIDVAVAVNNWHGLAKPKTLELYIDANTVYTNNLNSSDSIFGHAAVPEAIAVGAINVNNPEIIAPYSSQGPFKMFDGKTRKKPDICGAAGVSITGAGGFPNPFYGTSAAAPHVAAVAALLWSKNPGSNATKIRDMLMKNAEDMGTKGFDYIYGFGKVDALKAIRSNADNKAPQAKITSPSKDIIITSDTYTISGTISDNDKINAKTVKLFINSNNGGEVLAETKTDCVSTFSFDNVHLAAGRNQIRVEVIDAWNNTSASSPKNDTRMIGVDTAVPNLSVDDITIFDQRPLMEGIQVVSKTLTVSGTVTDDTAQANKIELKINGKKVTAAENGTFTYNIALKNGDNQITVTAKDQAGNITTNTTYTVCLLESIPPKVTIKTPKQNVISKESGAYTIDGTISETANVTLYLSNNGGTESTVGTMMTVNKAFSFSPTLSEGINVLRIEAIDTSGNVSISNIKTDTRTITVDQNPPILEYINFNGVPASNTTINANKLTIQGKLNDDFSTASKDLTVKINDKSVRVASDLTFTYSLSLIIGQSKSISIIIKDKAGNEIYENYSVTYVVGD